MLLIDILFLLKKLCLYLMNLLMLILLLLRLIFF